jgi:membrane protein DedA with SNARE-associated domain
MIQLWTNHFAFLLPHLLTIFLALFLENALMLVSIGVDYNLYATIKLCLFCSLISAIIDVGIFLVVRKYFYVVTNFFGEKEIENMLIKIRPSFQKHKYYLLILYRLFPMSRMPVLIISAIDDVNTAEVILTNLLGALIWSIIWFIVVGKWIVSTVSLLRFYIS